MKYHNVDSLELNEYKKKEQILIKSMLTKKFLREKKTIMNKTMPIFSIC